MAYKPPRHDVSHREPAAGVVGQERAGRSSPYGAQHRSAHSQHEMHVDQDAGRTARSRGSTNGKRPLRSTKRIVAGAQAQQRRHDRVDPARRRERRRRSSSRVAKLSHRHDPLSKLLRGPRGTPSWSTLHGRSPVRSSTAQRSNRRTVAMEETIARVKAVRCQHVSLTLQTADPTESHQTQDRLST